ncbi:MAG: arginyltransferase [Chromatiaceae bacterium]
MTNLGFQQRLTLFLTGSRPCAYLPEREERVLFVDPRVPMNGPLYESLLWKGFRRAGRFVYRPACGPCQSCVPVRLEVNHVVLNRSQRRNHSQNSDLILSDHPAEFAPEHFALYATYIRHRHPDGGMADQLTPESYQDYLIQPWGGETRLLEFRLGERLIALAVTDRLPNALSAVYTVFDPAVATRAPGAYAILSQIALARRLGLQYLYLGYWIQDCRKMAYKDRYRPIQALIGERWQAFERGQPINEKDWQGVIFPEPVNLRL